MKGARRVREAAPGKRASLGWWRAPGRLHRPPKPLIMAFIDTLRAEGYAVESICRVLREQGRQIAARTYRAWRAARQPAARTVSDATVINAIVDASFTTDSRGRRRLTPEGLYGRRKMTAYLRRNGFPDIAACTVDRCMRILGVEGVRRGRKVRTTIPAKDGRRAGDLLDRDFTAAAPNRIWVADFSYVRTWLGFVYVAFIVSLSRCLCKQVVDLVVGSGVPPPWMVCRALRGQAWTAGSAARHVDRGCGPAGLAEMEEPRRVSQPGLASHNVTSSRPGKARLSAP